MQLTVREVAKLLNVAEKTVYRWIHQEKLPACRVNDQFRFNRAELLEWATSHEIPASPDLFQKPENGPAAVSGLTEALRAGGIFHGLPGSDKESTLRAVVERLRLPEDVDREFLLKVILAREALGSTAVGDGIAIPHVRNPIVLRAPRPLVALCFLERPIDFGALDGRPVHALFSLICPTVKAHLHLLSRLGFVLQDAGFKGAIARRAPAEEIFSELARADGALGRGGEDGKGEG